MTTPSATRHTCPVGVPTTGPTVRRTTRPIARTSARTRALIAASSTALIAALAALPAEARVTRIVIDEVKPLAEPEAGGVATEQVAGRAFGELDPAAASHPLINDVLLARDPDGKVRYVATFVITRPKDPARASGLMWHEVPNRGLRRPNVPAERANGDERRSPSELDGEVSDEWRSDGGP